jgi:cell division protein FtsW (lipid II flippase)
MSARNRELLGLLPATALVVAGFTAVFIQRENTLSNTSLTYGAIFLALCLATHIFLRFTLPYADPYLFPLAALLASFGIVMIYRIDAIDARQQAQWFVVGLILFAATILIFRDYRKLEQYRYVIVVVSLLLLFLPRLPGIGDEVNGAYLNIKLGPITFQPTEFSKLGLVVFLASYLRDTRQVLVLGAHRIFGVTLPPLKHFGPVLVIWGVAMISLVLLSDIGSSVMFYGALLAMLYVATGRVSFVVIGLIAFIAGAWFLGTHISHVHARFIDWQHPFEKSVYNAFGGSFQVANGNFAMAAGGLFGQGFGESIIATAGAHGTQLIPEADTDMIYAVITSELGLFGAIAVLIAYILFVYRGFIAAMMSSDSFSKLMATGLSAVFALQVFVIVGGVTRTIPLTGVTLPFISYGGASIVANFVLLALLLLVSNRARRPQQARL